MKNKIAFKLTIYFSIALLLFTLIIGGIFTTLFKRHTIELHKADLKNRATVMANNLSDYLKSPTGMGGMGRMGGMHKGYGAYIGFLEDIAMTDVWIVEENLELITTNHMGHHNYEYKDLPIDAEAVVQDVFLGNTTFSQGFSQLLNTPTLTIGAPIKYGEKVIGALLLHSPVSGTNKIIYQGLKILLISLIIALVIAILLSIFIALGFTKPLKKINHTALKLAEGKYSVKTDVKQEDEIGELASNMDILSERLYQACKESERLGKLRQDFIANISHELRTPVTIIRGSLEALNDKVVEEPSQVEEYHSQMLKESIYLQRFVNDLLELSRLQNLDFSIEEEKINFIDVIKDVTRSGNHIAKTKDIRIEKKIDKNLFIIVGDYGRLRQMILIILDNAIKFSPRESIITISFSQGILTIKDRGIGISKEDLPHIFDRFSRTSSEQNKKGTGLGLAIAKQIAYRHNIDIKIESEAGKGTRVRLTLEENS